MYENVGSFAVFRVNKNTFDVFKGDEFTTHSRFIVRNNTTHLVTGVSLSKEDYSLIRKHLKDKV